MQENLDMRISEENEAMEEAIKAANQAYRITKKDTKISILAKRAAVICQFAIHNPLHVAFEDRNYDPRYKLEAEKQWNEKYRKKNGELLYHLIRSFLIEMDKMTEEEGQEVYKLFRKKWDYLAERVHKTIAAESSPKNKGVSYRHYVGEDGHVYIETDTGTKMRFF